MAMLWTLAAYVGDERVGTVVQLDTAVADRLADEDIATYAKAGRGGVHPPGADPAGAGGGLRGRGRPVRRPRQ